MVYIIGSKKKKDDNYIEIPSRRKTLEYMLKGAGLLFTGSLPIINSGCKKNPTMPPQPPPPDPDPEKINVTVDFYNHMKGKRKTVLYSGDPGDNLIIKVSDAEASDVDPNRIALRESIVGNMIGEYVDFSRNGEISMKFPNADSEYAAFLMNTSNGADYSEIDYWVDRVGGFLRYNRDLIYHREDRDGFKGKQELINNAVSELNSITQRNWIKYGSIGKIRSGGDLGIGYGYCGGNLGEKDVGGAREWAGVNPDACGKDETLMQRVFIAEIYEITIRVGDLGGGKASYPYITTSNGKLEPFAKDLFLYVYAIDKR